MLVLSRMLNEAIKLTIPAGTLFSKEAQITISVLKIGKQTKLGIAAPDVRPHRAARGRYGDYGSSLRIPRGRAGRGSSARGGAAVKRSSGILEAAGPVLRGWRHDDRRGNVRPRESRAGRELLANGDRQPQGKPPQRHARLQADRARRSKGRQEPAGVRFADGLA